MRCAIAFLTLAAFVAPTSVSARGETSYTLPVVREAVPPSSNIERKSAWSRSISTPPVYASLMPHTMLAIAPSMVAFVSHGHVCGFRNTTGVRLWCAVAGAAPGFAGGHVAYTAFGKGVEVVDAGTGARLWSVPGAVAAWPAGNDFLIAGESPHRTISEYDRSGHKLWSVGGPSVENGGMTVTPPYAFLSAEYSGATMTIVQYAMRLGAGGGSASEYNNAWNILDVDPPRLIYETSPIEEIQDHFLTFDIEVADLSDGAVQASYHYEPDYDVNNALLSSSNAYAGRGSGPIRIDGNDVYVMFYGEKIYRYRLGDPTTQRPLLLSAHGRFLGGPYRGWLYVSRRDGVWALRPAPRAIEARLVTPPGSRLAIVADVVFVTTADQEVIGIDPLDGRTVFDAHPCVGGGTESGIGGNADTIYIVCKDRTESRVSAYPTPRR